MSDRDATTTEAPQTPLQHRGVAEATAAAAEGEPPKEEGATLQGPDGEEPEGAHGRIGYGRYGRYTPLALAALLIAGLVLIGLYQRQPEAASFRIGHLVGRPAPDVTLTRLDGTSIRLAELNGNVVIVNFWASWCVPCREEAPVFQAVHEAAARTGDRVVVVGVGIRTDNDADARAFVRDLGLTYPIGRDTNTDAPGVGPIERAFGIPSAYPITVFVRPDGVVDQVHVGPLDEEGVRSAIAEATA